MRVESILQIKEFLASNNVFGFFALNCKDRIGLLSEELDIGRQIGYLLWVLRGANKLSSIQYYTDFFDHATDNGQELRGAIGPRMRFWVGADQLQEAIEVNMNVDEDQDFVKPSGVDQFRKVYDDLCSGDLHTSTMSFYDPAIDFDDTNDVPDLLSITFINNSEKGTLDIHLNYSVLEFSRVFAYDVFLAKFLNKALAEMCGFDIGEMFITCGVADLSNSMVIDNCEYYKTNVFVDIEHDSIVENDIYFSEDLITLYNLDRHIRCIVNENNFMNNDVSVTSLSVDIKSKIINEIKSPYLRNMGIALLVWTIKEKMTNIMHDGEMYRTTEEIEVYMKVLLDEIGGEFSVHIAKYLLYKGDNSLDIYDRCQEILECQENHI